MVAVYVICAAVGGALLAGLLACIPALHIYNVLGLLVLGWPLLGQCLAPPPEAMIAFFAGAIVGWAMLNSIPSVLAAAPDESAYFTVLPGQAYLMRGRGYEAVMLTALGGLGGALLLVLAGSLLAPRYLPFVKSVVQPHFHWMVWVVIAFMLLSEWPKEGATGQGGWRRFAAAWIGPGVGIATFLLTGLFGFVLMYRPLVAPAAAFQNLMPAFIGLFALPSLLLNILSRAEIPAQRICRSLGVDARQTLKGWAAGALGGGFAALVPAVTGGVGAMLAGHATAQRDERVFLIAQGASKVMYYAGGFFLFFVPQAAMTRGGGVQLFRALGLPASRNGHLYALAAVAVAAAAAFFIVGPLTRGMLRLIGRLDYRHFSLGALALCIALVAGLTGAAGLLVMGVGTGLGLLPLLYGSRRMNCLGIILLPVACNMSGIGPLVAMGLGLMK